MACAPSSRSIGLTVVALLVAALAAPARADRSDAVTEFSKHVQPLLVDRCYDCHGDGMKKGGVAFDQSASTAALVGDHELWAKVLKNVRGGLMPPPKKGKLSEDEKQRLASWIKYDAFGLDAAAPDPGRVTLRRLNRVEYRNTIRELMGVDFKADEEFPADDTGYGFDNIGDVLTVSPLLLEKYLDAARQIVDEAVPATARVVAETLVPGKEFSRADGPSSRPSKAKDGSLSLSFYQPGSVNASVHLEHAGTYTVVLEMTVKGRYAEQGFDYNRCEVAFSIDGAEQLRKEHGWDQKRELNYEFPEQWQAGEHQFAVSLKPLTHDLPHYGEIELQLADVKLIGPQEREHWVRPRNYQRFFGDGAEGITDASQRHEIARRVLRDFASKAFRRPVDEATVDRLVGLAEQVYNRGDKSFQQGIQHAMVAVLASPRFVFREESTEPADAKERFPRVDEYSLASRLSYFLWSSMPDEELLRLAAAGELRKNQAAQVKRMLADPRSEALVKNFAGQWLQSRDVENIPIEPRRLADRDTIRRVGLDTDRGKREIRTAMRQELDRYFDFVVREDRNVLELIDSNYTFVNERLAKYYGIPNVSGDEMRRVTLPDDSPRGGILTAGGVLLVTSNPTRTSPVKRGLYVLENVLGTPIPPPPPDLPALEEAAKQFKDHTPTLRETLAVHRASPVCSSCHNRMDPLGLAFENFSALGLWREKDQGQPIDAAGKLASGESFTNVRELKHILATDRHTDFYRCLAEKLLTYALGRGLEYYDVETVDKIVAELERNDGRFSVLLDGVIDSAPFQRRRAVADNPSPATAPAAKNETEEATP